MVKQSRSLRDWLGDIVEWGERLSTYIDDMDEAGFLGDDKTQDAVVRCIECIGEASRNILSDHPTPADLELVEAYWARNRFAHGYYDLNMSRVWETASVSVPRLVDGAKRVLVSMGG